MDPIEKGKNDMVGRKIFTALNASRQRVKTGPYPVRNGTERSTARLET